MLFIAMYYYFWLVLLSSNLLLHACSKWMLHTINIITRQLAENKNRRSEFNDSDNLQIQAELQSVLVLINFYWVLMTSY